MLLAALTPVAASIAWLDQGFADPSLLSLVLATAGVTAVPLFLHAGSSGFVSAIGVISVFLLVWSYIAAMAGMFVFFPSVLQLWLAAAADPRRRPTAAKVMAGAGLALSVLLLAHFYGE
ncbi:hypothetical protein SVTN_15655 [Streptomyces vietnamensis]|uniref:Uncharacterized protein n=1 Tax=Streptomyces vietnamensis TaxID=362257 RepID=A0A0B5I5H6_9ACTN|nr:hypothetical protein SVTN_15655 [Streptomyces vietnamensis]